MKKNGQAKFIPPFSLENTQGMTLVEIIVSLFISLFLVVVVMRSFLPLVSGDQQAQSINHNREVLRSFEGAIAERLLFKKHIVSGHLANRNLIMFSKIDSNGNEYETLRCDPKFFKETKLINGVLKSQTQLYGTFGSGKFASNYIYSSSYNDFQPLTGPDVPTELNDARVRCRSYGSPIEHIGNGTTSLNFCVRIQNTMPSKPGDSNYDADMAEYKSMSHQAFTAQYSVFAEIHFDLVDLRTGGAVSCGDFGSLENAGAHIFYTMYWHKEKYAKGNRYFNRKTGYFLATPSSN